MKRWQMVLLMLTLMGGFAAVVVAQAADASKVVPKYNPATEVTLKGPVVEMSNRLCPVSGGMGFHFTMKPSDGQIIEVHVATSSFVKEMEMVLAKGESVTVIGSRVTYDGVETVFAREITIGQETFTFRDKSGKPIW